MEIDPILADHICSLCGWLCYMAAALNINLLRPGTVSGISLFFIGMCIGFDVMDLIQYFST